MLQIKNLRLGMAPLVLGLFVVSCATTRDVMPGENGINRVSLKASDDVQGKELAISEAKQYCKDKNQEAVFIDDKTQYNGSMDEDTRKTIKQASHAAMAVGGLANVGSWGAGDYHNDTGNVIGGAGAVGHIMTDGNDYQVDVKFRCR